MKVYSLEHNGNLIGLYKSIGVAVEGVDWRVEQSGDEITRTSIDSDNIMSFIHTKSGDMFTITHQSVYG